MAAYFTNGDGSIRDFTTAEIDAMEIETYDIEEGGFPTHTAGPDGVTIKATYFCKYSLFDRFQCYMTGAATDYLDGGDLKISRMLPQRWPGKVSVACVRIDSATGHQFIADDGTGLLVPTYEKMKCALTFQQLPFDMDHDVSTTNERNRYVQVMPSVSEVQYLNLPGGAMCYVVSGGVDGPPATPVPHKRAIPYGIGYPIPTSTIGRKWHRVPKDCWGPGTPLHQRVFGNIQSGTKPWVGTCNVETMLGYPPGFLLYLGPEEEIGWDPVEDDLCWTLTHKWLARTVAPHNWMYFFSTLDADAAANGWYLAVKKGGTYSTIELLPDETGLFNSRQHELLFRTY